jgi:hypothetical protein
MFFTFFPLRLLLLLLLLLLQAHFLLLLLLLWVPGMLLSPAGTVS